MTKQEFLTAFENSLRGEKVSAEFLEEQVKLLSEKIETLPEEDFQKSAGDENVSMLVKSSVEEYLARTRQTSAPTSKHIKVDASDTVVIETKKIDSINIKEPKTEKNVKTEEPKTDSNADTAPIKKAAPVPKKKTVAKPAKSDKKSSYNDIVSMDIRPASKGNKSTSEKKNFISALIAKAESNTPSLLFTIITILFFPLLILFAFLTVGTLASLYFALAAVILAIVLLIIFIVLSGSLTALVALLYGATQIMQEPRYVGIHEIGLALMILGGTILASVLLYNLAVRLIPWVLSKASVLFKFIFTKVKLLAEKLRKGCEKL